MLPFSRKVKPLPPLTQVGTCASLDASLRCISPQPTHHQVLLVFFNPPGTCLSVLLFLCSHQPGLFKNWPTRHTQTCCPSMSSAVTMFISLSKVEFLFRYDMMHESVRRSSGCRSMSSHKMSIPPKPAPRSRGGAAPAPLGNPQWNCP